MGAYLASAGAPIPVDGVNTSSMIAGWNPDETHWLSPCDRSTHEYAHWILEDEGTDMVWERS